METQENLFLKSKLGLGVDHFLAATPETFPKKITLTFVEMLKLPGIENTDHKGQFLSEVDNFYKGKKKYCANFNAGTDKINSVLRC